MLLLYFDDIVITGIDIDCIIALKECLHQNLSIKDHDPLKYFLGIEAACSKAGLCLNQRNFFLSFLMVRA